MPSKHWSSIGVESEVLDQLKDLKAQWERRSRRRFTWGQFFAILLGFEDWEQRLEAERESEYMHMEQPRPGEAGASSETEETGEGEEMYMIFEPQLERLAERLAHSISDLVGERIVQKVADLLESRGVKGTATPSGTDDSIAQPPTGATMQEDSESLD